MHLSEGVIWLIAIFGTMVVLIGCVFLYEFLHKLHMKKVHEFDKSIKTFKSNKQVIFDDRSSSVRIIQPDNKKGPYDYKADSRTYSE